MTTSQPRFAIIYEYSIHDGRDAIVGSTSRLVEGRVFQTAGLAHKIAGQLEAHDWEHGGDGGYQVWDLVRRVRHFLPITREQALLDDFIPF